MSNTQLTQEEIAKEIEKFGGVVLMNNKPPLEFPFSSEDVFRQIAAGNFLRFDENSAFCWKKSPFAIKGYAGSLGKPSVQNSESVVDSTRPEVDAVIDLLNGQTIDIEVYEVRLLKSKGSQPIGRIESYLKVLHQRDASGKTVGKYYVEFKFNSADAVIYKIVYENGIKESHSMSMGHLDIDEECTCSCFGQPRAKKFIGLRFDKPLPKKFLVEDNLNLVKRDQVDQDK
jgi:hypothetical protein